MFKFLYVGLGGALGAILRYSFYFLPIPYNKTIFINILGAIIIGFISYFTKNIKMLDHRRPAVLVRPSAVKSATVRSQNAH